MTEFETITFDVNGGIAFITINRPDKHNALLLRTLHELRDAIEHASQDDAVGVLVLGAVGDRVFSAGIDMASGLFEDADNLTSNMQDSVLPLLETMQRNDKPLLGSVRGMAVGLAASIALSCDLLIMAEDAELRFVFSNLGIVPDGGACWQLVDKLGYSKALEIALDGRTLSAGQCESLGLANRVVPAEALGEATASWAKSLAASSRVSQPLTKSLMKKAANGASMLDIANLEAEAQGQCVASDYCIQAYTAFLDSRATPKKTNH